MSQLLRIILADDLLEDKIAPIVANICQWLEPSVSRALAISMAEDVMGRVRGLVNGISKFVLLDWTRDYDEALRWLQAEHSWDIAIIDLRWANREQASSGKLDNSGLELLRVA